MSIFDNMRMLCILVMLEWTYYSVLYYMEFVDAYEHDFTKWFLWQILFLASLSIFYWNKYYVIIISILVLW